MGRGWPLSLAVAALVTLVLTPPLRRLARATGIVDRRADARGEQSPTPCLGGVAFVLSLLFAVVLTWPATASRSAVVVGALIVAALGLADDARSLRPGTRLLAELVPAVLAVAAGVQLEATGVPAVDVALTSLWIVGVTNAMNFVDNIDGLAAGVAAVGATAIVALAVAAGRPAVAVLAAATVGASAAFLVYNRLPASVFMGDAGSLFLGYVLAVTAVDVSADMARAQSVIVPLLLCAVPVVDLATVTLARLHHGRSIVEGGKDHLSHRLVLAGIPAGGAVLALVGTQAAAGTMAFGAGNDVVRLSVAVLVMVITLGTVVAFTARVTVYAAPEPADRQARYHPPGGRSGRGRRSRAGLGQASSDRAPP